MSHPFDKDDAYNATKIKYLTIENVLGDYIDLINFIKTKYNAHETPVIAFGGGYGGNLAAWMRMKYP
jgi:lysosomal Pro-X carboxypeptidase